MPRIPNYDRFHTIDVLMDWYLPVLLKRLGLVDDIKNYTEQGENLIIELENYRFQHPKDFKLFSKKVEKFQLLAQSVNVTPEMFVKPPITRQKNLLRILALILFFPIPLYGLLNNLLALLVDKFFSKKGNESPNIQEPAKSLGVIWVYPVFYIIQAALVGYFSGKWWIAVLYLISLPIFAFLTTIYQSMIDKLVQEQAFRQLLKDPNNEFLVLYREIIYMMDNIIEV